VVEVEKRFWVWASPVGVEAPSWQQQQQLLLRSHSCRKTPNRWVADVMNMAAEVAEVTF